MNSYKELLVWQKSMDLVEEIYQATKQFPQQEQYGLTAQMRRAAVSIPSNIAEGYTRSQTKEYIRFLRISKASAAELETQLILCHRLQLTEINSSDQLLERVEVILKMLSVLIKKLNDKI